MRKLGIGMFCVALCMAVALILPHVGRTDIDVYDASERELFNPQVSDKSITAISFPAPLLRSRWIWLPGFVFIEGTDTKFDIIPTVAYDPSTALVVVPGLSLGNFIIQFVLVNPAWLANVTEETSPETVTVTADGVSDTITINLLPFILDEKSF